MNTITLLDRESFQIQNYFFTFGYAAKTEVVMLI